MSLNFNGTSGYVALVPAGTGAWTAGCTVAAIVNYAALGAARAIYYSGAGASANASLGFGTLATNVIYSHFANTERTAITLAATGQYFIGITKTSGTTTPIHYSYRYSNDTMTQTNASGTAGNAQTTARAVEEIGRFGGTGDYFSGDIFILGIWNTILTPQEMRSLCVGRGWVRPNLQSLWVPGMDGTTSVRDLAQREHSSSVNGSPTIGTAGLPGFNWSPMRRLAA